MSNKIDFGGASAPPPGSGGVSSINGASGGLTLAGASGIAIDTVGLILTVDGGSLLPLDGSRFMTGPLTNLAEINVSGLSIFDAGLIPSVSGQGVIGGASLTFNEVNADTGNFVVKVTTPEIIANSGTFPDGVVLQDSNGSGWLVSVTPIGELSTNGPFVLE